MIGILVNKTRKMLKPIKKTLIIILSLIILLIVIFRAFDLYTVILKKFYPDKYAEYVYKYSEEYNVESDWVFALIKTESNFKPDIVSNSGAIGLMQVMEQTAKEESEGMEIESIDLKDPETNIMLGTKYFSKLVRYYNNSYYLAMAAYNAGIGRVEKWIEDGVIREDGSDIENIPYKETNNYVRKMLKNYKMYKELY